VAQIGTFRNTGSGYCGTVETLTIKAEVTLEAIRSSSDKAPDFRVYKDHCEVGIAFKRTSEKGNEYISVLFDDPSFAKPIWANLLLGKDDIEKLPLMWDRPKVKKDE
jgi:uncharacterized protein (DUF736 family)